MAFEVFKPLADSILSSLTGWTAIAGTLIGAVKPVLVAALTVRMAWQGLTAIRGGGGNVLFDVILSNLRVVLVWWGALAAGSYAANVQGLALDLRNGFSELFVPGAVDGYSALDQMMTSATNALSSIFSWGDAHWSLVPPNSSGLVAILCGLAMALCMTIFAIVACANLLFVDLALVFLFAVGPVFVACFAFQSTAQFFSSWLGAVLKYVFTTVVITAICSMAISIMAGYSAKLEATHDTLDFLTTTCAAVGASGVLIFFAARAASLAADIIGGVAINAMSASSVGGAFMRGMGSIGGGSANAAAFGAGAVASTSAGQAIASTTAGSVVSNVVSAASNFGSALSSPSLSGAYAAGRGGSISAGSASPPSAPPPPAPPPVAPAPTPATASGGAKP